MSVSSYRMVVFGLPTRYADHISSTYKGMQKNIGKKPPWLACHPLR
jgi:hypothetical protein